MVYSYLNDIESLFSIIAATLTIIVAVRQLMHRK